MNDKTKIVIARLLCGTAILLVKAFTGVDGTLTAISLFLLGVPVEYATHSKEKD